jgi:hypothetical protein
MRSKIAGVLIDQPLENSVVWLESHGGIERVVAASA